MKVYPHTFTNHKYSNLAIQIPSGSDSLTYSNIDTPQANYTYKHNYYTRIGSTHSVLKFSRSREKKKSKRATTEPEEQDLKIFESKNVQESSNLEVDKEKKVFLEFDKMKFKRIKTDIKKKIEDVGIRRENSKEFLLDFDVNKDLASTLKVEPEVSSSNNRERRNKNMSQCMEPRPKTILHRAQASTVVIPLLSFTDRPKRSVSKSQHKSEVLKTGDPQKQRKIQKEVRKPPHPILLQSNKHKVKRKISYLKTQPEQPTNPIEAEFEQFLKTEQTNLAISRKKREQIMNIPLLQFGKPHKQIKPTQSSQTQNRKYQYSSFYDREVNHRNNQLKAKTSRQMVNQCIEPQSSYRSNKQFQETIPSSLNSSRKNLRS